MRILAVIPARGGSKGIPRKNVRFMAGSPLISYVIKVANRCKYITDVVVTSDDDEIKNVSVLYGAQILNRPERLAEDHVTLDPVIYDAVCQMESRIEEKYDLVVTIQPTSPLLTVNTLENALRYAIDGDYDTVISGINDSHLSWGIVDGKCVPKYEKRLNRQYLPIDLRETGAFVISKREFVTEQSRFGNSVSVYEVPENEAVDIDTPRDWWIAEKELSKKNIIIRMEGYSEIGLGHVYRGLLLADAFIEHNVLLVIGQKSDLGIQKLGQSNFPYRVINNEEDFMSLIKEFEADIVINDILNTGKEYIKRLKEAGVRVVNFEDEGAGVNLADAVINALYESKEGLKNCYYGSAYYLIRDEFVLIKDIQFREECKEILVLFGGTDPNDLTKKCLDGLIRLSKEMVFHVTVILGLGYPQKEEVQKLLEDKKDVFSLECDVKIMSTYMSQADLAISSQGRTMLELAAMGVPTIVMAQNERESMHGFGTMKNGFVNLGAGTDVDEEMLFQTIKWLMLSPKIRKNMHEQMLSRNLKDGMKRVKPIILGEQT